MKIMKVAYRECPTRILQVTHQSGTAAIMHEPTALLQLLLDIQSAYICCILEHLANMLLTIDIYIHLRRIVLLWGKKYS